MAFGAQLVEEGSAFFDKGDSAALRASLRCDTPLRERYFLRRTRRSQK
jgi:ketosteroid isomerase-like protein